jgi:hypothetical protein
LNFYPEDFLMKAPSLIAYLNRYRESKVPETTKLNFSTTTGRSIVSRVVDPVLRVRRIMLLRWQAL